MPPETIWQAFVVVIVGHTGMRPLFVIVFVTDDAEVDTVAATFFSVMEYLKGSAFTVNIKAPPLRTRWGSETEALPV